MAGLLLVLVVLLHIGLAFWLLKSTEPTKAPELLTMEVSMVSMPGPKTEITPPEPQKPEPPKKEPVKQLIKKKIPVIAKQAVLPKQADLPKPQPVDDEQPWLPNTAPAAPVSVPQPVSPPAPAVVNSEPKASSGVVELECIAPKYPARAANRHIEGWVKIEITITTSGNVENAQVVEAEPAEIFDEAALSAINKCRFKEKIVDGVAVEQRAFKTFRFNLPK
jgi:protein TonB